MKKALSVILALTLTFSLAACGSSSDKMCIRDRIMYLGCDPEDANEKALISALFCPIAPI